VQRDTNKDLVRRFYREAINERDSAACERLLSEDFVDEMDTGAILKQLLG
jgi:ketosteroid isomerase-like protein